METTFNPTPSQPTSNPPGGGSWTWDGIANQWVEATAPSDPVPTTKE